MECDNRLLKEQERYHCVNIHYCLHCSVISLEVCCWCFGVGLWRQVWGAGLSEDYLIMECYTDIILLDRMNVFDSVLHFFTTMK